ncbi:hypothetical protein GCM10028862_02950 [Luteimonas pelagia]
MRLWKQLVGAEAVAMGWLIVVAGLMAAFGALGAVHSPGMIGPAGSAHIGFLGTFLFGLLPVTLYGAPVYVWLSRTGRANWVSVSAVALVPAALLLLVQLELGLFSILCGPPVAWLTHLVCRGWVSPNNSFKPNPLRGSA